MEKRGYSGYLCVIQNGRKLSTLLLCLIIVIDQICNLNILIACLLSHKGRESEL